MIFQDHVLWQDADKYSDHFNQLKKRLADAIGNRWPVSIKFHPSKVKSIPDADAVGGYRIEKPPEYNITLEWAAKGLDGKKHVYTYCDNYDPDPVTKKNKYYPVVKTLPGGSGTFTIDDLEFVMWLFLAFPKLQGGMNEDKNPNDIVFDLPHLESKRANEYKTLYAEILVAITNRKLGMPMDELRRMLTSYFVPKVENMEDYEVMNAMEVKATEGTTEEQKVASMKLFLQRSNNTEGLRVRYLCQKALEHDPAVIIWIPTRMAYCMVVDGKPMDPPLCIVNPGENGLQKLHEVMGAHHQDELKLIETFLEPGGKKSKAKKDEE